MRRSRAFIEDRREKLLLALQCCGKINMQRLAEEFKISPQTIRRDLQHLKLQNKLAWISGGTDIKEEITKTTLKQEKESAYSQRMAKHAASLVDDGDTIFINSDAAVLQMLYYMNDKRVTVVTNSVKALYMEFPSNISVYICGGEVRENAEAMTGVFAINNLRRVIAKKSFIGCSGLSAECGVTTENMDEANINQLMLKQDIGNRYILADHTKLGRNGCFMSCPIDFLFNVNIITDNNAPEELIDGFRRCGVKLIQVA